MSSNFGNTSAHLKGMKKKNDQISFLLLSFLHKHSLVSLYFEDDRSSHLTCAEHSKLFHSTTQHDLFLTMKKKTNFNSDREKLTSASKKYTSFFFFGRILQSKLYQANEQKEGCDRHTLLFFHHTDTPSGLSPIDS
jgi:hypothetical protein